MELRDLIRLYDPLPSAHPGVTSPVLYLHACVCVQQRQVVYVSKFQATVTIVAGSLLPPVCANRRATRYRLSPRADTPAWWHGVFNGERLSAVVLVCLQRSVQKQTVQILERGIKMRGVKVALVS